MGLGLLFLCLGGAWLAGIAHRTLGLPAVSTLEHACPTRSLQVSSHLPTSLEVEANIFVSLNTGLFNKEIPMIANALSKTSAYVLMFDEIKIEEVICYSTADNQMVGICHEHSGGYGLEYSSVHEVAQLFKGEKEGMVHIATVRDHACSC